MDWTQTKAIAEANLDAIVGKAPNLRAVLTALSGRITAEVAKVEAYLASLDTRAMDLPNLLEQADQKVAKVQAVIAKAKSDGRADLVAAAQGRLAKEAGDRDALQKEFDNLEQTQMTADEWLSKLQDKSLEIEARITRLPPDKKPAPGEAAAPVDLSAVEALTPPAPKPAAPAPKPAAAAPAPAPKAAAPAPAPKAAAPAPAPKPPAPAAAAKPAAPAAKPAGKKDALDDEFAALFAELNVDPSKIELPKKAPPKAIEVDDGIPDLVTVSDNELPEGEELPPLEMPKKGAPAKPGAPAAAKPGTAAPAKPPMTASAKAPTPAPKAATPASKPSPASAQPAAEAASGGKTWLWISLGVVGIGGAGAAVAHFVYGIF